MGKYISSHSVTNLEYLFYWSSSSRLISLSRNPQQSILKMYTRRQRKGEKLWKNLFTWKNIGTFVIFHKNYFCNIWFFSYEEKRLTLFIEGWSIFLFKRTNVFWILLNSAMPEKSKYKCVQGYLRGNHSWNWHKR